MRPLHTLEQVSLWVPDDPLNINVLKIKNYKRNNTKSKMIVCHDFRGGYLEDHWLYGFNDTDHCYRVYN